MDPNTRQPDAPPPPAPPPPDDDDGVKVTISDKAYRDDDGEGTGWSLAAGIIGIIGAVAVLGLGVASELTKEDQIPSLPLGAGATVLVAALGPTEFAGGSSARRASGATGLSGLRITGWVTYGVSLLIALNLIVLGLIDVTPFDGLIATATGVGSLSLTCFAIDDFVIYSEAKEGVIAEGPSWLPTVVLAKESSGAAVPTLGMAARF